MGIIKSTFSWYFLFGCIIFFIGIISLINSKNIRIEEIKIYTETERLENLKNLRHLNDYLDEEKPGIRESS
jgi:hypothetical protein